MTTTSTKTVRQPPAAPPEARREHTRNLGRDLGTLAVNAYERGVADIVAFEKDAAKVTPYPWAKNALIMSADLIEDVGAAYVKTARRVLK